MIGRQGFGPAGSMGDQIIDIILFALVALFFVVQLWRVLGQRTGTERPPVVPPTVSRVPVAQDNVVAMPQRTAAPVPPPDPVEAGLAQIRGADPSFDPAAFKAGAAHAFEFIVTAFAAGDLPSLRPLSSDEVYAAFAEAISQRAALKETVETKIVRMEEPVILEAKLDNRMAIVTVRFVSRQISVTRAADGTIAEGDADLPIQHNDVWVFTRNTRAADPNWLLIATSTPE
jgi:predicted lipid-binding transport protein (Tim44 family)